jgi:OOP family OmpA-OmpF porin
MKKNATKSFLLAACVSVLSLSSFGQSNAKPNAIGLNIGTTEYAGDVKYGFSSFQDLSPSVGLTLDRYLNKSFNSQIAISTGKFGGSRDGDPIVEFETFFIDFGVNLKYKFNNGYILKEESKLAPYVWTGLGFIDYKAKNKSGLLNNPGDLFPDNTKEAAFRYPIGLGVNYSLNTSWALNLQGSWTKPASDELDNHNVKKPKDRNDRLMMYQLGVAYSFGAKDTDDDGVPDKYDRCPELPGDESTFGCPDADNDGVLDADDKCPNIKGIVFGCPDSDEDGFIDSEDKCPDVAGSLYGCLDTDQDGVADVDDSCPEVKGCINGCPDMDGDGLVDAQDECPEVFGSKANKGCPNFADEEPVVVTYKKDGTPMPSGTRVEREKAHQSTAIFMVFFDHNSSVLNRDLQAEVEKIAAILNENKDYYVILEGHTDSKGSDKYNDWLCGRRVDKVTSHLISKGVDKNRILFVKYGESMPLLPNDSVTGSGKNRRVVMKVVKN